MALEDVELNLGSGGAKIAVDNIGDKSYEVVKQAFGEEGDMTLVSLVNPLPVISDKTGLSTSDNQDLEISALNSLLSKDFATQTTLLALLSALGSPFQQGGSVGITGTVTTLESSPSTVINGKKSVTTAGTAVSLASSTTCKSVTVKALISNTGLIYVGATGVSSSDGFELSAGDSLSLDISNLNLIYINSSVNSEGVSYIAVN